MPVAATVETSSIRSLIETAIGDLLHNADHESVDLRRASRSVFEDACLDERDWERFVDEWIHVAYEAAGEKLAYCDFHDLTVWCTCGHSHADHQLDCQSCDCERFTRSRSAKRPKQRVRTGRVNPVAANRERCIELENARFRHLFGDLTGGV